MKKSVIQIGFITLISTLAVAGVVWATTTIGTNITTGGIITLSNSEYIDNRTDGYISLMGIASTSSIFFGTNAETIDNATNGYVNIGGAFSVSNKATTTAAGIYMPGSYITPGPTCDATVAGGLIYNATSKKLCICDGSGWTAATSSLGAPCY